MLKFEYSTLINAPVEIVWQFHERADILNILTPPWQPVYIIRREGGLEIGAITEFLILFPIPIRWLARHIEYEQYHFFTDKQIEGPMELWIHRHQFTSENDKTRLTDTIEYQLYGGELAEFFLSWWIHSRLDDMFKYRHQITKKECENYHL